MDKGPNSPHRRAWDAIPWVVAGTASEPETRHVHEHLVHCADCQAEWQFQQQVRAGLANGLQPLLPAPDAALARLMDRIDEASATAAGKASDTVPSTAPGVTAVRGDGMSTTTGRWLVAAVLVQAVALGVSGLGWWQASRADFQTLTDATAPAAVTAPVPALVPAIRVIPAPDFDFAALQALLARHQLVIVGADAGGSYLALAPTDGQAATARAALQALRVHPGLRRVEAAHLDAQR